MAVADQPQVKAVQHVPDAAPDKDQTTTTAKLLANQTGVIFLWNSIWFAVLSINLPPLVEIFNPTGDVDPGDLAENRGQQRPLGRKAFVKMDQLNFGSVPHFPFFSPKPAAPISVFHVQKETFIHQPHFINRFLFRNQTSAQEPINRP